MQTTTAQTDAIITTIKRSLLLLVVVVLTLGASPAFARLKSAYTLELRQDFNDNIYLSERDKINDFVTQVTPSLKFDLNTGLVEADLSYRFYSRFYSSNSEENQKGHDLKAKLHATAVKKLFYIDVEEAFMKLPRDPRIKTNEDETNINMVNENIVTVSPYLEKEFSAKATGRAGYIFTNVEHDGDTTNDYTYNTFFAALSYMLSAKLTASADYSFSQMDSDIVDGGFDRHSLSAGAAYKVTPEVALKINAGTAWFDYESKGKDQEPFWNVELDKESKKGAGLNVRYSQSFEDSVSFGAYTEEKASMKVSYGGKIKASAEISYMEEDYLQIDRSDKTKRLDLGIVWRPSPAAMLSLMTDSMVRNFANPDEEVRRNGAAASLRYRVKKDIYLTGRYRYVERDSDIDSNSYDNNIYSLIATASF